MDHVNVENPHKVCHQKPMHNPKLGFFIYIMATCAVIGGFLFGYGTGIVSEAMLYVAKNSDMKPVSNFWHELIVSVTPGMAAVGALFAGKSSDTLGRKKTIVGSAIIFTIGGVITAFAFYKWILLIGRIFLGFAIGVSSMVVPIYVSEASPSNIRGFLGTCFQLMVCIGLFLANVIAASFSYIDPERIGWRLMFGFAAVPSTIQFIGFFFLPESPRFLYENFGAKSSKEVLMKIYNQDEEWADYELEEIRIVYEKENKDKREHGGGGFVLGRILTTPHIRKALLIGCSLMAFQQLTGVNTVMYYSGTIIKAAGVKNNHTNMWVSCSTVGAFVVFTFVPLYLIEKTGRKKLLIGSMLGMIICLLVLGSSFLAINKNSAKVLRMDGVEPGWFDPSTKNFDKCAKYSNCDFCVTDEDCGFCTRQGQENTNGFCLPAYSNESDTRSSTGYCYNKTSSDSDNFHSINLSSGYVRYEWDNSYCHTKFDFVPLIVNVIFIAFYAAGLAPMPWVLNSEFYPLWARSTCASITTFVNWIFNLIISLTFLSLSQAITKYGTFYLYAGITIFAMILFIIVVPETKGLNLDEVELLFMGKNDRIKHEGKLKSKNLYIIPSNSDDEKIKL